MTASGFSKATQLSDGNEVVDNLPSDDETLLASGEYDLVAEFDAYIKGSRITVAGELQLTVAIPYEWKYEAMPVTDIRGITFRMVVLGPKRPGSDNGQGSDNSDHSKDGMGEERRMETLPIESWTHSDENGG